MALQQQLRHARRTSKVSVNLKGWVVIKQVRQSRFCQQRHDVLVDQVPIFQARPEVYDTGSTPSGVSASGLQTPLERNSRRSRQLRCAAQRDLVSRMQGKQG